MVYEVRRASVIPFPCILPSLIITRCNILKPWLLRAVSSLKLSYEDEWSCYCFKKNCIVFLFKNYSKMTSQLVLVMAGKDCCWCFCIQHFCIMAQWNCQLYGISCWLQLLLRAPRTVWRWSFITVTSLLVFGSKSTDLKLAVKNDFIYSGEVHSKWE